MPDQTDIDPYHALIAHLRVALRQPGVDQACVELDLASEVSVQWCWDSPTSGHLMADIPTPRILDVTTLTDLASFALLSALRYHAIVIPDQRKQRLKLLHPNLTADLDGVMLAVESLLNQCDVLTALLIEGPLRATPRKI